MKSLLKTALITAMLFTGVRADAVLLPHSVNMYLYSQAAGSSVRFDGLVNLPDGTAYIPVIPSETKDVNALKIEWTYPENKTIADKPDIILFNNNYALLKVIKDGRKCTFTGYENIPDVIKRGILPQDLLVPNGFYIKENFRGITGNLEIPVVETAIKKSDSAKGSNTTIFDQNKPSAKKTASVSRTYKKVVKTVMPKELSNKMYLITNFDSQYLKVFSPGRPEPVYGLKLKGILKDVAVTPDNRYLVAAVFGKNQIDIADIHNEQIAKTLDLDAQPSEIIIDKAYHKMYILSTEGKSIYIADLSDMNISEKIVLNAAPYRMAISPDGTQIAYADKYTNNIYILKTDDEYKNVPVTKCENVSKIILDNANRMYIISRTNNILQINDYNLSKPYVTAEETDTKNVRLQKKFAQNTRNMLGNFKILPENVESIDNSEIEPTCATVEQYSIKIGTKPTEMLLKGNHLYVLCSGDREIDVINTETLQSVGKIEIPFKGFPRKITRVDNTSIALVTDADTKKYAVINLDTYKVIGTYPIDIPVNSITIINKINNINVLEQTL